MIFYKTSSFGNDFIEIDAGELTCLQGRRSLGGLSSSSADKGALARQICDRRRGVGADGAVLYRMRGRTPHFEIFNRDGSAAELSGNGMAGLAAVLLQRRLGQSPLVLQAAIGRRRVVLVERRGAVFHLDVEIGTPDFADRVFFPFLCGPQGRRPPGGRRQDRDSYRAAGIEFHPVSVGNPHAVVICREMPGDGRLTALGGKLAGHPMFPKQVNVEFVHVASQVNCRVFFYERGVGPTLASSTGSAAVFSVLRRLGLAGDRLDIECGYGKIQVSWENGIHVRNVTRLVCRGEFFL